MRGKVILWQSAATVEIEAPFVRYWVNVWLFWVDMRCMDGLVCQVYLQTLTLLERHQAIKSCNVCNKLCVCVMFVMNLRTSLSPSFIKGVHNQKYNPFCGSSLCGNWECLGCGARAECVRKRENLSPESNTSRFHLWTKSLSQHWHISLAVSM